MDFSKAFDKVPHSRLLDKLSYNGVHGTTLNWVKSFLAKRKQEVLLDGVHSSPADVTSGVSRRTVLEPLLFLAYINYLPDAVQNISMKLFAGDCLLFKAIKQTVTNKPYNLTCPHWGDGNQIGKWSLIPTNVQ